MTAYVKNTPGAPTGGRFFIGDTVTDSEGREWQCVISGWPGEWISDASGVTASPVSNSITGNILLNNTSLYFDGPSVNVTPGTWFAAGTVTMGAAANATFFAKLWDGTTVASAASQRMSEVESVSIALSGVFVIAAPSVIKISVRDLTNTSGVMLGNATVNGDKDSSIRAFRIA